MYERVSNLLKDDQDLLLEFTNFLPEMGAEHQRVRNESSRPVPPTQIQISPSSSAIKRESTGSASEIASPGLSTSGHQVAVRESPGSSSTPPTQKSSPSSQRPYTPSNASGGSNPVAGDKRKNSPNDRVVPGMKKRVLSGVTLHDAAKFVTDKELVFFERVKKTLKTEAVYANFLRCLALYNNEIVSRTELANLVSPFIGKSPELLQDLHRILGLESANERQESRYMSSAGSVAAHTPPTQIQIRPESQSAPAIQTPNRPEGDSFNPHAAPNSKLGHPFDIDYSALKRLGSSYREMPAQHQSKIATKDPLAASVLNDVWVSLPTWSEDSQFSSSKKNQYEGKYGDV